MGPNLFVGDVSQWVLCLLQITGLLFGSWVAGRMVQRRFPDIAASIGMVALTVSAILVVITFAGVPRPFDLSTNAEALAPTTAKVNPDRNATTPNSNIDSAALLDRLATLINYSTTIQSLPETGKESWSTTTPTVVIISLLLMTALGSLAGIFRAIHSSIVIYLMARSSTLIEDPIVQTEVSRIVAKVPGSVVLKNISVRKIRGLGSPFVSWLTGNTIYVPDAFLNWSTTERSASLAHEIGHLLRRDHYCHVVTQLSFCLTWLHPLSWALRRQTMLAQELAADQMAAQLTESTTAYCRGLSRLALRFDAECRHPSTIGVSVSSNLIRRITMLRKSTFHRLPCSQFINRLITSFAFLACSWIGCWAVGAQTPQEKQEDSKVVRASHTSPVKMFSQPTTRPWDSIGNQSGYVSVQASRILNHPEFEIYQPILTSALDSVLRSTSGEKVSSEGFGLEISNIELIQSGLQLSYHYNANESDGHRSQLSMGASTVEITAVNPVDWPELIDAIDLEKLSGYFADLPAVELDIVQKAWVKSAKNGRSNVFQTDALMGGANIDWEEPTETKKALWGAVSGGAATAVYDIIHSGEVPADYKEEDAFNQANLEMTLATQTAAWGIDLTPDYKICQIRFAAVPRAGVSMDQFLKKFDAVKNVMLATDADDDFSRHFVEQLKKAKVSVVEGQTENGLTTSSYLLVVGECSADFGKYGLIKNVAAPPSPQSNVEVKTKRE